MKRLLPAVVSVLCGALPACAGSWEDVTPYFSTRYFTWQEEIGGRRLLKESGALFSIGAVAGYLTNSSFILTGRGELFGGEVGYSGETQPPDEKPVRTDVAYFGTRGELDAGYRVGSAQFRVAPFVGIGHRWWLRDLQDTTSTDGGAVSGYTEMWQTIYGRTGVRGELAPSAQLTIVAEGGAKYPFYTGNSVDFAGSGVTTFRPGARWSAFAETGLAYRSVRLTMNYEGFRFSQSPWKRVGDTNYFQPRSSSDIFGASLGWTFR